MSRFIDADMVEYFKTFNPDKGEKTIADMAWRSDIDSIPTADVVEVVRCKDCKWNKSTPHNPICSNDDMPKDVGFFCADGERREDAEIH